MRSTVFFIFIAAFLSGCASIPEERKSPCACDWQPINAEVQKAVS